MLPSAGAHVGEDVMLMSKSQSGPSVGPLESDQLLNFLWSLLVGDSENMKDFLSQSMSGHLYRLVSPSPSVDWTFLVILVLGIIFLLRKHSLQQILHLTGAKSG